MGATVSREHAKLPFGYTHARREDHTFTTTASSSLTTRRQRLAHRLLFIKSSDSTSITPLQLHRLHLTEDGGIMPDGSILPTIRELGGIGSPTAAEQSLGSHWSNDDEDSENAEIVSLNSILNQGPEFELQWHAVGQDYDEGFYSSSSINAIASGSGTRTAVLSGADLEQNNFPPHSSSTLKTIDRSSCTQCPQEPQVQRIQSKSDRETASDLCILSSLGSPKSASVIINPDATQEIVDSLGIESTQSCTTSIATASAVTTTAFSLSSPTQSDDFRYNEHGGSNSSASGSNNGQDEKIQKKEGYPERPRIYPTQHLQKRSFKAIRQDLTDTEDETDEEQTMANDRRKMDIISALGIADARDEWQYNTPFKFFNEEPTFHPLTEQFRPQMTQRRYTTDGGSYGHPKGLGTWMDYDCYEGVVHLPQDFFDSHRHHFVDGDDGLDEEIDPDGDEGDENGYLRTRRFNRGRSIGTSAPLYSTATLRSAGHSLLNYPITISADEDVAHFSPIPFSDLPSLTNIGLCSHGIVKLSSNIRLLTSATCLQICCNDLCNIPVEIGFLRNLTLLDLSKNNLKSLPDSIQFLSKLVDLKLSFNYIESLPSVVGGLTKLTSLCLDNNRITRIPSQIGQLRNLATLDLDDNPISVLPAEIGQLHFLRRLKLERCPLVSEFTHSLLHSPPTLLDLAARVIVRHGMEVPAMLPSHLKMYLKAAQQCSFCAGPYFESSFKRGKLVEKNDNTIPFEYILCMPHWNTDMERIKLLFGPRPITAPSPLPSKITSTATLSTNSSRNGSRRHTESQSSSTLASLSNNPVSASSPVSATVDHSNEPLTPLSSTGGTPTLQNSENMLMELPPSSNSSQLRGFRTRMRSMSKNVNNGVPNANNTATTTNIGRYPSPPPSSSPSTSKSRFPIRLKSRGDRQQFSSP